MLYPLRAKAHWCRNASILLGWFVLVPAVAPAQSDLIRNAAEALQQKAYTTYLSANGNYFVQNNTGNSFFNYWWNANALDVLTDGYLRTRQERYRQRMKTLLRGIKTQHGGTYINDYYDDMEWLTLACLKAYEATGDREYYEVAQLLWDDIQTGRSPEYQGAVTWNKDCHPSCKNAISNSPAALIGARLYRINGNAQPLAIAEEVHAFLKNRLVNPATGGVWDSYNPVDNTTNKNPDWVFSYNVGMYLSASVELYKVTGNQTYLEDAVKSADFAVNNRLVNNVLFTNERGQGDGGLFKGIFVRSLIQLAREGDLPAETSQRYYEIIQYNAQTLIARGTRSDGLVGPVWNEAPAAGASLDFSTQLSGIMLLEAAATADQVILNQHINYGGYHVPLSPGTYPLSQLTALGGKDNDITSISVPPGYRVTGFENDDFAGARLELTTRRSWLGDWNDRISSVIVARRDITEQGGTLTAQHNDSPSGEGIANLIDNRVGTKYLTVHHAGWVQFKAAQRYVVDGYTLTSANDFAERDPLHWTLEASNDGSTWTTLDRRSGEDFPARFLTRIYSVENATGYLYYRLNISGNNQGSILQLAELALWGTAEANHESNTGQVIQAEEYTGMSGVATEPTTDEGGGQNVGWVEQGDWMAYHNINVPASGSYTIRYRVASPEGSVLSSDLNAGAVSLGNVNVPATGGWQNWITVSHTVTLDAGTYNFGIHAQQGGWNINWWSIQPAGQARTAQRKEKPELRPSPEPPSSVSTDLLVYPNPARDYLQLGDGLSLPDQEISIRSISGNVLRRRQKTASSTIDVSELPPGLFVITLYRSGQPVHQKFVKE